MLWLWSTYLLETNIETQPSGRKALIFLIWRVPRKNIAEKELATDAADTPVFVGAWGTWVAWHILYFNYQEGSKEEKEKTKRMRTLYYDVIVEYLSFRDQHSVTTKWKEGSFFESGELPRNNIAERELATAAADTPV